MKKKLTYICLMLSLLMMSSMQVFASSGAEAGGIKWGVVIIVPLIIALIVCAVMSGSMKSVHTATSAKQYEKEGSFNVSISKDTYTHTTEEHIHHESSTPQNK